MSTDNWSKGYNLFQPGGSAPNHSDLCKTVGQSNADAALRGWQTAQSDHQKSGQGNSSSRGK